MRTLNIGAGKDPFGTDKLDIKQLQEGVKHFDINSGKPLPYKDNTFAEIRLYNMMELLVDPQLVLEECYRVLQGGGKLDIRTINIESKRFAIKPLKDRYSTGLAEWEKDKRMGYFTEHTLKNRLLLAGFKTESIQTYAQGRIFPFKDHLCASAVKRARKS
ncbi:MAG: methyltransferase domain-containing protein [Candidatus Micrarchaeota archaeon]|nr:methyltransferase domain-containing protein [Candidatus Micrarchaeota archaeon]